MYNIEIMKCSYKMKIITVYHHNHHKSNGTTAPTTFALFFTCKNGSMREFTRRSVLIPPKTSYTMSNLTIWRVTALTELVCITAYTTPVVQTFAVMTWIMKVSYPFSPRFLLLSSFKSVRTEMTMLLLYRSFVCSSLHLKAG